MTVPFDPRAGRQRSLTAFLRLGSIAVLTTALVGTTVPGDVGRGAAVLMSGLLIAIPVVRAVWLALRWWHKGDRRFAVLALTLVALVATGALLAS